jgi:hypothetical protein
MVIRSRIFKKALQCSGVVVLFSSLAAAQTASLNLSSGSATAGSVATLNLSLASTVSQPAAVQWTVTYSTTDFTGLNVAAGAAATAAGKSISCNNAPGVSTCVVYGINSSTIANGVVATLAFTISASTTDASSAIQVSNSLSASLSATATTTSAAGSTLTILPVVPTVTAISCTPDSVIPPTPSTCMVTISPAAPAGGTSLVLSSDNSHATVSTPLLVTVGATSASFSVTTSAVTSDTTAHLTATLGASSVTFPLGLVAPVTSSLQFHPIAPCRLVDTRGTAGGFNGIAPFSGPSIAAGETLTIPVQSAIEGGVNTTPAPCGTIPSTAQAYSLNLTVVPHAGGPVDYVSLWPAGLPAPSASTLDDPEGLIVANAAIVEAGAPSGGINVFNAGPSTADVIIDMNGYFTAATALQFYPVAPCRLVDTRGLAVGFNGISPFSGPSLSAGTTLTIPVQSTTEASANTEPAPCGTIPSTAQAYSLNLTVVPDEGGPVDYVSMWPAGSSQPFVSTIDDPEGLIVSNAAVVAAGAPTGGVSVFNAGPAAANLVIDMNGYFAPPTSALQFFPVPPCRLVDTRGLSAGFDGIAPFSGPSIPAGATLTIPVQSAAEASANTEPAPCGVIPSSAQAYSINLTVVPHAKGAVDYVSLWPAGSSKPFVSTLNDPEGLIVANAAIVPAGTPFGGMNVFNAGPSAADVVIDMNGYFAAPD